MISKGKTFTFEERIHLESHEEAALNEYASIFSQLEHTLYANFCKGIPLAKEKSAQLIQFGVTGRQHNACRTQLDGKIEACKASLAFRIATTQEQIKSIENKLSKIKNKLVIHQKKRRLAILKDKHAKLLQDKNQEKARLCFGSKRLFHKQFNLKAGGFSSHAEWKEEWQASRNSSFFVLGSKDETSGNQSCSATINESGTIDLRLRLPDALKSHGKYFLLKNLHFHNGHEALTHALKDCILRNRLQRIKDPAYIDHGQAINYRFVRDHKSWKVYATLTIPPKPIVTRQDCGVIGIDLNVDHLAVTETDRFGNPIHKITIPLSTYGKSRDQTKAIIGEAAKEITSYALATHKPIVLEKLDFRKKKGSLRESNPKYARMLSCFAYEQTKAMISSRAFREGVQVLEVNPAFTSVIGLVKFSGRYGLSKHHAAALCIGRRALGAQEKIPRHLNKIPDGKWGYVALSLPARNRGKHVWSSWGAISKRLRAVHAVQARAVKSRSSDTLKAV